MRRAADVVSVELAMLAVVRVLAACLMVVLTPSDVGAEPRWPTEDPTYAFIAASGCDRPRPAAIEACADQMALFAAARAEAAASGKSLLVVFGATWCPSCKGLKTALPEALTESGLAVRIYVVEITISTLDRGKVVPVPSGEAVRADLVRARPEFKQRAIPFIAVIDPVNGRTSARNLDDLEQSGAWSRKGLARVVGLAEGDARGGAAAPGEPSWLMRKWRRWFGD